MVSRLPPALVVDKFREKTLDPNRWNTQVGWIRGEVTVGDGVARIRAATDAPPGPGLMAFSGLATRQKVFEPYLKGECLLEVTLTDFAHSEEYVCKGIAADGAASDHEDPHTGKYLMGFCLTIGTFPGMVGSEPDKIKDRAVQIHFDWWSRIGLWYPLNRNIIPGDRGKIRLWDDKTDPQEMEMSHTINAPVITLPGNSVVVAWRHDPKGDNRPWGHRMGLRLTEDGNTLSWVLDGQIMDSVDISGFFQSSPGCVADGAYASIVGGGCWRENIWTISEARIV